MRRDKIVPVRAPKDKALSEEAARSTECDGEGFKRNVACGAGPAGPQPAYIPRACENRPILKNKYGSYLCMTKDNMGARTHGYGGSGDTNCAAIDMVVGRGSCKKVGDDKAVDPLPFDDAARIYISQKADIDDYFALPEGAVGNSEARSAILCKADAIRIVGREGVKIISGVAKPDENNSQGGMCARAGIDLIGMYSDGLDKNGAALLQPLVKGDNLVRCLETMVTNLDNLAELVGSFLSFQLEFNADVAGHMHLESYFAAATLANPTLIPAGIIMAKHLAGQSIPDVIKNKLMFFSVKSNYLMESGDGYILSGFNQTN